MTRASSGNSAKAKSKRKAAAYEAAPLFINFKPNDDRAKTLIDYVRTIAAEMNLPFGKLASVYEEVAKELSGLSLKTIPRKLAVELLTAKMHEAAPPLKENLGQIPAISFTPNALTVLEKRYLKKDEHGRVVETPEQMLWRVADAVASSDQIFDANADVARTARTFYELMACNLFWPNSPTLMNAGRELGQLSACFVLPVGDSMEDIFEAVKETALIHKSGGGTGFSFNRLRPKNDRVHSTKGVASGPVSFMSVFDRATDTVKQGGTRRGANMGVLRVDHPDIIEFITAKADRNNLQNFNLSVAVTDAFMDAVKNNGEYDLIHPRTGLPAGSLKAKQIWDLIVDMAWSNGEPGLLFIDRVNISNPTPQLGEIESTNPCGEQPLLPYESCNLGSINLESMVKNGSIDWQLLKATVREAVHFLDNVIEANKFPLPEIEVMTKANRKIGLGVMGFSRMLIRLGIPYDSPKALKEAAQVMEMISATALESSIALANSRGPFPNWTRSIYKDSPPGRAPRNAARTTIAPTGTISIMANAASGIEPIYALCYWRNVLDGERLLEIDPLFLEIAKRENFATDEVMEKIAERGSCQGIEAIPKNIQRLFVTSHDISLEWHIKMQAAFQKHTDNAVSKTVNLPADASREDVEKAFIMAYELGCKGVTVYRYGSRDPVLSLGRPSGMDESETEKDADGKAYIQPRSRGEKLSGTTSLSSIGCGKLYVTVNSDDKGICEVFTSTGRSGGCPSQSEALGRVISVALRGGMDPEALINQLKGIRCYSAIRNSAKSGKATSCPSAIAKAIETIIKGKGDAEEKETKSGKAYPQKKQSKSHAATEVSDSTPTELARQKAEEKSALAKGICPDCRSPIEYEGGCVVCRSCGFSKCN